LISLLPRNPIVTRTVEEIGPDTDWECILDTKCSFKLLYLLRTIEQIVNITAESPEEQRRQSEWFSAFLASNGFKRLYDLFLSWESGSSSGSDGGAGDGGSHDGASASLGKECLESLLKLINAFILGTYSSTSTTQVVT